MAAKVIVTKIDTDCDEKWDFLCKGEPSKLINILGSRNLRADLYGH